jgi:hypothetical protein
MALIDGEELGDALDIPYNDGYVATLDQVAAAADAIVASLITTAAYTAEYAACKEAAISVGVELYQARTASGGQPVALDFTPSPYRLSLWLTKRVSSLLAPYLNVGSLVG